jgi:autotransporter-associated beta strand protein
MHKLLFMNLPELSSFVRRSRFKLQLTTSISVQTKNRGAIFSESLVAHRAKFEPRNPRIASTTMEKPMKTSEPNSPVRPASSRFAIKCLAATLIAVALLAVPCTQAGTVYWDSDANGANNNIITGAGLGGTGNWNNSLSGTPLLNWWAGSGTTDTTWVNANNDTAVFWGAAGNATLTSNTTVGGLLFNITGYKVDTGANTLTFGAGSNMVTLNNSATSTGIAVVSGTIIGAVTGPGNVTLTGGANGGIASNTLTFAGTSTTGWTGATTVNNKQILTLLSSSQALVSTSGITLNNGRILLSNASSEATLNRVNDTAVITSNGGIFTLTNAVAAVNYQETIGTVALTSNRLLFLFSSENTSGTQLLTLSGLTHAGANNTSGVAFAAPTGLNTGTNQVKVTGASATTAGQIIGPWATVGAAENAQTDYAVYNGTTNVLAANIAASAETAWTTATDSYTLTGATTLGANRTIDALRYTGVGATLALGGFTLATNGLLNGGSSAWTISGGILTRGTAGAGNLYLISGSSGITISAAINDNGGALTLVKDGMGGTATLSSITSSFSGGLVMNLGNLDITETRNLGDLNGDVTFNGNAALKITGGNQTLAAGRDFIINNTALATLNTTAASSVTTIAGIVSGTGGIIATPLAGSTLTFSGLNTYTGPTFVNTGTLKAGAATTGANGAFGNNSAVTLANVAGVNLDITGFNNTIGSLHGGGAAGGNVILGAATLTVGGNNENTTFAGVISGAGGSLVKTGTGAMTLTGANTYTGGTTVSVGTLLVSGSLTGTTAVTVANSGSKLQLGGNNQINSAATLTLTSGILDTQGNSQTFGSLASTGSSILDLGAAASILNFANSNAQTWSGTLSIYNWTGTVGTGGGADQVIFASQGLTSGQLNSINFYSDAGTTFLGTAGWASGNINEIVAIPEPATWTLLAGAGTFLIVMRRRRFVA